MFSIKDTFSSFNEVFPCTRLNNSIDKKINILSQWIFPLTKLLQVSSLSYSIRFFISTKYYFKTFNLL